MPRMKTDIPARKVTAATLGAAASQVLVWYLNDFVLSDPIPAAVAAAITTLMVFLGGYFVLPHERDTVMTGRDAPSNDRTEGVA